MGNENKGMRHGDYPVGKRQKSAWGKEKKRDPSKKDEDVVAVKSVKLRDFQKTQTAPLLLDLLDEAYERRMVDVRSPTRRLEENPIPPLDQPEKSRFPELQTNKNIERLLQNLPYRNPQVVLEQCSSVMTHFENIRPIIAFHTATADLLMCMEGPIAVECRDEEYFAPIAIWLHVDFPLEAPSVYVTSNGVILQHGHSHVTPQGEVLSPYLRDWNSNSSLIGLLDTLVNLFSHNPVFAVSSDSEDLFDAFTNDRYSSDDEKDFKRNNHPLSPQDFETQLSDIFDHFNEGGDGRLTFDEFVTSWQQLQLDPETNLLDTFNLLDSRTQGYITIEEFTSFIRSREDPQKLIERHSDFVKGAVHEFLVMTGLWPMCENVLIKNRYDLQKSYDEFCTRGIGQMIRMEANEILQSLPEKIQNERFQRYEAELTGLMRENEILNERIQIMQQQDNNINMMQDTWYDGTDATDNTLNGGPMAANMGSENIEQMSSEMNDKPTGSYE